LRLEAHGSLPLLARVALRRRDGGGASSDRAGVRVLPTLSFAPAAGESEAASAPASSASKGAGPWACDGCAWPREFPGAGNGGTELASDGTLGTEDLS
jgi:hypothetical protein